MDALHYAFPAAFVLLMLAAAVSDVVSLRIPNAVVIAGVAAFAVAIPVLGLGAAAIAWHVIAGMAVLSIGFALFAAGWIGGGDAKLAAVAALWLGFGNLPLFLVLTSVAGGVLTLAILFLRRRPLPSGAATLPLLSRIQGQAAAVPYGVAIAIAGLALLPQTNWLAGMV